MATTRIKDISKTTTDLASDTYGVFDGATNGTQKMSRNDMYADWAAAYTAAPTTYKLAPLNSGTNKIDATYLPVSGDTPKGEWNASTNSPSLADGSGTAGDYYDVTTAGSQDLGSGSITFTVGDVVKYNGSTWYKIDSVANFLDGYSTAATSRAALEVNSIDEDAEATGTKLVGPALYFDGVNDYLEVADDSKLSFSSSAEFGTNSSGTWSPNDNTPALTDGTGTLNQHYRVDSGAGTVTQGASTLSVINGTATTAGQAVYYDGSVWRLKDVDDLPFSVDVWLRKKDGDKFFVQKVTNNREWGLSWENVTDKMRFYVDSDNSVGYSYADATLLGSDYDDEWVHLCWTYNGAGPNSTNDYSSAMAGVSMYVNGVAQSVTQFNNAFGTYCGMPNTDDPFRINNNNGVYGKNHVRSLRVYNRELTATEVAQLARGTDLGFADEWGDHTTNLVTDGDMETGGVANWSTTTVTATKEVASPHGGSQNLKAILNGDVSGFVQTSTATVSANRRYRAKFWYRTGGTAPTAYTFRVDGSTWQIVSTLSANASWTYHESEFVVNNDTIGKPSFHINNGVDADTYIEVDDFEVVAIGKLADFRAENFIADKLIDLSSNNFVGTNNGATLVGGRKALQLDTDGAAAGNNVLSVFNGSSHLAYVTDKGDLNANSISSGASTELTIATGAVTATKSYHTIDTESDAASDDLDTISGGRAGQMLIVQANNSARSVVLKDGTGNLKLSGDITLDNAEDTATLVSDGTSWYLIATSNNGA